jgi:excisionase family DNA binding protein
LCLTTDTTDVRRPSEGGDTQFGDLPLKTLLKPDEVGRFLGVSSNTVYRWYHFGLIEGVKVKGILRIYRDSVLKLAEEKG